MESCLRAAEALGDLLTGNQGRFRQSRQVDIEQHLENILGQIQGIRDEITRRLNEGDVSTAQTDFFGVWRVFGKVEAELHRLVQATGLSRNLSHKSKEARDALEQTRKDSIFWLLQGLERSEQNPNSLESNQKNDLVESLLLAVLHPSSTPGVFAALLRSIHHPDEEIRQLVRSGLWPLYLELQRLSQREFPKARGPRDMAPERATWQNWIEMRAELKTILPTLFTLKFDCLLSQLRAAKVFGREITADQQERYLSILEEGGLDQSVNTSLEALAVYRVLDEILRDHFRSRAQGGVGANAALNLKHTQGSFRSHFVYYQPKTHNGELDEPLPIFLSWRKSEAVFEPILGIEYSPLLSLALFESWTGEPQNELSRRFGKLFLELLKDIKDSHSDTVESQRAALLTERISARFEEIQRNWDHQVDQLFEEVAALAELSDENLQLKQSEILTSLKALLAQYPIRYSLIRCTDGKSLDQAAAAHGFPQLADDIRRIALNQR